MRKEIPLLSQNFTREIAEHPENYLGPDLNPEGLILQPQELAPGVYALLANIVPKDNNGVILCKFWNEWLMARFGESGMDEI